MAQWLERGTLQLPIPVKRVQIPLGTSLEIHVLFFPSQLYDIVFNVCVLARGTLYLHASLDASVNGCRTVWSEQV